MLMLSHFLQLPCHGMRIGIDHHVDRKSAVVSADRSGARSCRQDLPAGLCEALPAPRHAFVQCVLMLHRNLPAVMILAYSAATYLRGSSMSLEACLVDRLVDPHLGTCSSGL